MYISKLADKLSSMSAAEQRASQDQLTEENFEFLEIIGGTQGSFVTVKYYFLYTFFLLVSNDLK